MATDRGDADRRFDGHLGAARGNRSAVDQDQDATLSARLKAMLEMRRFDPAGEPLALDRHVFGNELAQIK